MLVILSSALERFAHLRIDHQVLDLIREFGRKLGRPENGIQHACNLASGLSGLVVILERPARRNYRLNFEQFVLACDTLKAVDDLIIFATDGAKSIYTVTILDAFSNCTTSSSRGRVGVFW